jgi:hypothetical protein
MEQSRLICSPHPTRTTSPSPISSTPPRNFHISTDYNYAKATPSLQALHTAPPHPAGWHLPYLRHDQDTERRIHPGRHVAARPRGKRRKIYFLTWPDESTLPRRLLFIRNLCSACCRLSRDVGSPRDDAVSCKSSWPPHSPPTPSLERHLDGHHTARPDRSSGCGSPLAR